MPLLAVASFYGEVPPGLVERIVRDTADAKATDPLVAAQAAYMLSRMEDDRAGRRGPASPSLSPLPQSGG